LDANYSGIKKYKLFLLFITTVFFVDNVKAQIQSFISEKSLSLDAEYAIEIFNTENGLPQNSVIDILQTQDGYLWFSTFAGIVKFDGVRFDVYNLQSSKGLLSNITLKLFEAPDKKLWIIDDAGHLLSYDGNRFNVFEKTLSQTPIRSICSLPNGQLIVSTTKNEVYRINNKNLDFVLRVNQQDLLGIVSTQNGNIYLKCSKGMYVYNDGLISPVSEFDEMKVFDVKSDMENNVWVSTSIGLHKIIGDEVEPVNIPDLSFGYETKIFIDHRNTVWVYNETGVSYSAQSDFTQLTEDHGLSSTSIRLVYEDMEKNIWIGTNNNGLNKLRYKLFRCISQEDGLLADGVAPLLKLSDQTILAGNNCGGINRFIYGKIFKNKIPANTCIWSLMEDTKGNIWYGTYGGGAFVYKNDKEILQYNRTNGLTGESVFAMFEDEKDNVWVGTDLGLFIISQNRKTVSRFHPEIFNTKVNYLFKDSQKNLWVATNNGLFRIQNEVIKVFNTYNGLSANTVRTIFEDAENNLWIGTVGGGLCKIKNDSVYHFQSLMNVLSADVFCLTLDNDDNFWITSNRGIYEINRKNLLAYAKGEVETIKINYYDRRDGLKTNEFNSGFQPNVLNETGNQIWFPTIKGVVIMNKFRYTENTYTPIVKIERILIDNEERKLDSSLTLSRDAKSFEFFFTAPKFHQQAKLFFEYRLEGYSNEWSPATIERVARFTNIKPGAYTFKVRLFSNAATETGITINIPVPFWQKPWFIAIIYASSILLLSLIMYLRIRHVRKREAVKSEVRRSFAELELKALQSQMNPHFIFNCLNTIKYFISKGDHQSANKYLGKFSKLLRMFLDQSKSVTISLEEEINLLRLYIELEQMRFSEGFNFHLQVESDLDYHNIELPGTLIQPYVENAINHGLINLKNKGNLSISFKEENGFLIGIVDDDGIGRKAAVEMKSQSTLNHTSHGMKLIEDRINAINFINNSTIETKIIDKHDDKGNPTGTRIIIKIPLQKN
jgi:ligand-binding sensor domain-containing protein